MLKKIEKTTKVTGQHLPYKIAIVTSLYHKELTKSMEDACKDELIRLGIKKEHIAVFDAPGSWEIPLVCQAVAKTKQYAGIAAFGVILKGDTYHFEMIANECSKALMHTALTYNVPIGFEVLATYTLAQAKKRALGKHNKGPEAAQALVHVLNTLASLQ